MMAMDDDLTFTQEFGNALLEVNMVMEKHGFQPVQSLCVDIAALQRLKRESENMIGSYNIARNAVDWKFLGTPIRGGIERAK